MRRNARALMAFVLLIAPVSNSLPEAVPQLSACQQLLSSKEYSAALSCALPLAKAGDLKAATLVAKIYSEDDAPVHDEVSATRWYARAAEGGEQFACIMLGLRYSWGIGVPPDQGRAFALWKKAADQGYPLGLYWVSVAYESGIGVTRDTAEANRFRTLAAEAGDSSAQYILADAYFYGEGVEKNHQRAFFWYRKAAEQNHMTAMGNVADMLAVGDGVAASRYDAVEWNYRLVSLFVDFGRDKNNNWHIPTYRSQTLERLGKMEALIPGHPLTKKLMARLYPAPEQDNTPEGTAQLPTTATGTAWVVAPGYLVTSNHVIGERKRVTARLSDESEIAVFIAQRDAANDLVVLRVEERKALPPPLPLASQSAPSGASVLTVGFPHPDTMGYTPKVTSGVVSSETGFRDDPRFYQITVPVQAGNSGGPLVNSRGEVVGVVTAKLDAIQVFKWTGDLPENVNYAIKSEYLRPLLRLVGVEPERLHLEPGHDPTAEEVARRVSVSVVLVRAE